MFWHLRYVFIAVIDVSLSESRWARFILLWSIYGSKVNFQSQDTQAIWSNQLC